MQAIRPHPQLISTRTTSHSRCLCLGIAIKVSLLEYQNITQHVGYINHWHRAPGTPRSWPPITSTVPLRMPTEENTKFQRAIVIDRLPVLFCLIVFLLNMFSFDLSQSIALCALLNVFHSLSYSFPDGGLIFLSIPFLVPTVIDSDSLQVIW